MNFEEVLPLLRLGVRAHRRGWNGVGMWIRVQRPDEKSKMTLPYIYMRTAHGCFVPWLASQTDILTDDWAVLGGDKEAAAAIDKRKVTFGEVKNGQAFMKGSCLFLRAESDDEAKGAFVVSDLPWVPFDDDEECELVSSRLEHLARSSVGLQSSIESALEEEA